MIVISEAITHSDYDGNGGEQQQNLFVQHYTLDPAKIDVGTIGANVYLCPFNSKNVAAVGVTVDVVSQSRTASV